jgi:hypothetical protein
MIAASTLFITSGATASDENNYFTKLDQAKELSIVDGDSTAQVTVFDLNTLINPNDHRPAPPRHDRPHRPPPRDRPYPPPPSRGSYFDWSRGNDGWGHCYEWASNGGVLNGGNPVSNSYCEDVNPSRYDWSRGNDGWGYCYQFTPYGDALNSGAAVSNYYCEEVARSYYSWGRGNDGYTHCYQYTANGIAMNQGAAVSDYYCR